MLVCDVWSLEKMMPSREVYLHFFWSSLFVTSEVLKKLWSTEKFVCKISVKFTSVRAKFKKSCSATISIMNFFCEVHLSDERSLENIMCSEEVHMRNFCEVHFRDKRSSPTWRRKVQNSYSTSGCIIAEMHKFISIFKYTPPFGCTYFRQESEVKSVLDF